ncbi:hypothetical protein GCM10023257_50510 [Streptomyces hyderabadensis]|uniref:Uncharacterized protein n=1 Tax=Streptomyces hyderabadensis TaxID=598549 RepID=A0ABP9IK20_9ACTN
MDHLRPGQIWGLVRRLGDVSRLRLALPDTPGRDEIVRNDSHTGRASNRRRSVSVQAPYEAAASGGRRAA